MLFEIESPDLKPGPLGLNESIFGDLYLSLKIAEGSESSDNTDKADDKQSDVG